jgi:hypothetical protein
MELICGAQKPTPVIDASPPCAQVQMVAVVVVVVAAVAAVVAAHCRLRWCMVLN